MTSFAYLERKREKLKEDPGIIHLKNIVFKLLHHTTILATKDDFKIHFNFKNKLEIPSESTNKFYL